MQRFAFQYIRISGFNYVIVVLGNDIGWFGGLWRFEVFNFFLQFVHLVAREQQALLGLG